MQIVAATNTGIKQAAAVLKTGGTIVYPTDTAYGLGGVFDSVKVVRKILAIKHRTDKKFVLVAADLAQVKKFFTLNRAAQKLAKKYWPGPVSLVVTKNYSVRVPDNIIARKLCRLIGKPLIATSANLAGQPAAYSLTKILKYFSGVKNQPDLIVSAGRLKKIKPSTVVKVKRNKVVVLRQGVIKIVY